MVKQRKYSIQRIRKHQDEKRNKKRMGLRNYHTSISPANRAEMKSKNKQKFWSVNSQLGNGRLEVNIGYHSRPAFHQRLNIDISDLPGHSRPLPLLHRVYALFPFSRCYDRLGPEPGIWTTMTACSGGSICCSATWALAGVQI